MTYCTPCSNRYLDNAVEYKPNLSRDEKCRCGNDWEAELRQMGLWRVYRVLAEDRPHDENPLYRDQLRDSADHDTESDQ